MTEIKVRTVIRPDGWPLGGILKPGLAGFCQFYLPTNSDGPIKELAVNVEVTGRTPQKREGSYHIRIKITFVGDGEKDTVVRGWTPYQW